jgi:guanyl-specific ribonuclease Sa
MERFFKLVGRFFSNRFRETKEQKALVEQTLLLSQVSYPGLAVATCSGCFMPTGIRNEIQTPKQQNRNEKALKLAQHILEKEVKILSPVILQPIKNDTRQMIENRKAEKNVSCIQKGGPNSYPNSGSVYGETKCKQCRDYCDREGFWPDYECPL